MLKVEYNRNDNELSAFVCLFIAIAALLSMLNFNFNLK